MSVLLYRDGRLVNEIELPHEAGGGTTIFLVDACKSNLRVSHTLAWENQIQYLRFSAANLDCINGSATDTECSQS